MAPPDASRCVVGGGTWEPAPRPYVEGWRLKDGAGIWGVSTPEPANPAERHAVMARLMERTLQAFAPLARARLIAFGTATDDPEKSGSMSFMCQEGETSEMMTARALPALAAFPHPLYYAEVLLEVNVWMETYRSPDEPERAWIYLADELTVWAGEPGEGPWAVLHSGHTLFYPDRSNHLFALNHPLLEQALREWDRVLGPVQVLDGWDGITPFGYELPPDEDD